MHRCLSTRSLSAFPSRHFDLRAVERGVSRSGQFGDLRDFEERFLSTARHSVRPPRWYPGSSDGRTLYITNPAHRDLLAIAQRRDGALVLITLLDRRSQRPAPARHRPSRPYSSSRRRQANVSSFDGLSHEVLAVRHA